MGLGRETSPFFLFFVSSKHSWLIVWWSEEEWTYLVIWDTSFFSVLLHYRNKKKDVIRKEERGIDS